MGGGFKNLSAVELSALCPAGQECKITNPQSEITNNGYFYANGSNGIFVDTTIGSFINYGELASQSKETIRIADKLSNNRIDTLTNYGTISGHIYTGNHGSIGTITNYGIMGSIYTSHIQDNHIAITINNLGIMNAYANNNRVEANLITKNSNASFVIQNYTIKIDETPTEFLAFSGYKTDDSAKKNSHLVVNDNNISFKDAHSKIILDFGSSFKEGEPYKLNKLIVNIDGTTALNVDFNRLMPYNDLYHITQSGDSFVVNLKPESSTIGNLYKSNIRTMSNFYTLSNAMIYPRKLHHSQNLGRTHSLLQHSSPSLAEGARGWVEYPSLRDSANLNISSLRASARERGNPPYEKSLDSALDSTLDSAIPLKSYESFAYRNESQNRRIQRQNKRNYNRKTNNAESSVKSQGGLPRATSRARNDNFNNSANESQNPHDYYFILTPFINHNLFFESGRYNLSGLEYGFLTAFSGKLTQNNTLGTHFMMSYGNLGDSTDKNFSITNLNLNLGLNYKFDMIWDSYIKARGDFFYFLNQVKTLTMPNAIKPNTLGFGVSVAYGKDFNFGNNGVLGLEVGLDYKALQSSTIELHDNTYQKSLYNLIYVDLGLNYNKYFNTSIGLWGINTTLGIKGNITANKLSKSQIHINNLNRDIDMVLDNDKILAYANISASYVLNHKDFDMEFSLAYYGNYGDRVISNGGGVEWRVEF